MGGPISAISSFALSPDGKRVVSERTVRDNKSDLWISDLEHGTESRFTFDAARNSQALWSPDGSKVAFSSNRDDLSGDNLYQRASNGTSQDELLLKTDRVAAPLDWTHDGRFLIFRKAQDLWALPLGAESKTRDKKPFPLIESEFNKGQAQVSPDSRWLAYTSTESGRPEVYVIPFSTESTNAAVGKWAISTAGGSAPRWRGDSKELFYLTPDRMLMSVEVKTSPQGFDRGVPQALFAAQSDIPPADISMHIYSISADGKRFLIRTAAGVREEQPPLTVVVNWLAAVKK